MIRSPLRSPLNPVLSAVVNRRRSAASDILAGLFVATDGVLYRYWNQANLFQDSAGTTPVTAAGQPVGLVLDESKGLVLGPELVTNGAFTSGTGWTDTGVATITYSAAGARIVSPANGAPLLSQNYAGAVNKTYVVDAEVVMHATPAAFAAVGVNIGGVGENLFVSTQFGLTAGNTYRLHGKVRLTSATTFLLRIGSSAGQNYALDFTIRNLSVRELPGNHFIQPTSTARPVVSAGFPQYLTFDGVDDDLGTGPITLGADMDCFIALRLDATPHDDAIISTSGTGKYILAMGGVGPVSVGSGTPTYAVNGVVVAATRVEILAAAPVGAFAVVEIRNADMSGWSEFTLSGWSPYRRAQSIGGVILCPAQTPKVRTQIRQYLGAKVGLAL